MLVGGHGEDKGDLPGNPRPVKMIYRIVEMQLRQIRTPAAILFLVTQGMLLHGCAEDTIPSGSTAISGRVLNPNGDPIDGAGIVVEYATIAAGAAPAFPQTADGQIVLKAPYPNPTSTGTMAIPIQVAHDTTLRVEIWAAIAGGNEIVDTPIVGRLVTQDTLVTWDGVDRTGAFPSTFAPNGLYRVRVTVPASGSETVQLEMPVLINQPATFNTSQETFNAQAFAGEYQITDIPVGEYYTGTQNNGTVRGRERISETLFLTISAQNYATQDVPVTITPGDVVSITTTLIPIPSAALIPRQ